MSSVLKQAVDVATFNLLARAALPLYPPRQQGKLKLISLSENATYCITTAQGDRFALRIHRPHYHDHADIQSELDWLAALQQHGIEVPRALAGSNESLIQLTAHGDIRCWVVMFAWIKGQEPDTSQNLNASFKRLGEVNARLHQQARHWQTPASFKRLTWDHHTMLSDQAHWGRWQEAPFVDNSMHAEIDEAVFCIQQQLANYGKDGSRFGLIHADLRLANLLVDQDQTHVIDFDDCGFSWYLHDLASALSFHEHHPQVAEWIRYWMEGYSSITQLDTDDLLILPSLIMQRRLQLLAWSGSHANTLLAKSLGEPWVRQTASLCRDYLAGRGVGTL